MKKQKGFTIVELFIAIFFITFLVCWPINVYQITKCDFKEDYQCEVKHGIGVLIFFASPITMWADTDEKKEDK